MLRVLLILWLLTPLALLKMEFVRVEAGNYVVGKRDHPRNPRRKVKLGTFDIATTEVTNAQFEVFIKATGYKTDAERNGFGMTFAEGMDDWQWESTKGATWRKPFGPLRPGIEGKANHPVTQISYRDALAFCQWGGFRLPTVEEWEVAARGGQKAGTPWPWGSELAPKGVWRANTWQGPSHRRNTKQDGFLYTAPVAQYPPNALGLYDVIGNVFEYCVDERDEQRRPLAYGRGGSWWCSQGTCDFYNLIDIGQMDPRGTLANQGFRVVRDVPD